MSDATLMLQVEAKKKSGWLAAFLNLLLPGAGYMYCARWILGFVVLAIVIALSVASGGIAYGPLVLILVADGFLCAGRYNKKLINKVLAEQARKSKLEAAYAQPSTKESVANATPKSPEPRIEPGMKQCPFCAELIRSEAIKCKHCGSVLSQPA